jgi:CRISPR-associated protein Csm3
MAQLIKKIIYDGEITLLTGTHIGGSNSSMGIGGPDKLVIRNPLNNKPIIPGSSLKGKMRSLIELNDGNLEIVEKKKKGRDVKEYQPTKDPTTKAGNLFGTVGENQQPSRLIVRDAHLTMEEHEFPNTDLPYTESKTEVNIDRITSEANPRNIERVPAGAKFKLNMVLNVFLDDNQEELMGTVLRAIKLLEDDYIGGNGSRGYGQIRIELQKPKERSRDWYINEAIK